MNGAPGAVDGFEVLPSGDERPTYEALSAAIDELRAGGRAQPATLRFAAQALDFLYVTLCVEDRQSRRGAPPAWRTWQAASIAAHLLKSRRAASLSEALEVAAAVVFQDKAAAYLSRVGRAYRKVKAREKGAHAVKVEAAHLAAAALELARLRAARTGQARASLLPGNKSA